MPGAARLTFALDDTPTPRYGRRVQGAGVHHNPTPGPAGGPFVYGHVWVVLGVLVTHPAWGVVALPLLARQDVRRKDLDGIAPAHRPAFRTKLEMAVVLMRWAVTAGFGGVTGQRHGFPGKTPYDAVRGRADYRAFDAAVRAEAR